MNNYKGNGAALVAALLLITSAHAQSSFQKTQAVSYAAVQITDAFWKPKIESVAAITIPVCIAQTEVNTPRIDNFEKVARKKGEKHQGIYYDDSDVYKALEAIAYSLKNHPDSALERKADAWIDKIAAAQEKDGYLNTYYSLLGLDKRWTDMEKHEDYCAGHLIEAAVAYYNTTGKRKLLDVAIRFADHIDATFPKQNRHWVSGHQEIELALVKLFKLTGDKKYLDLADWFLQQRGYGYGKGVIWDQWKSPEYAQDAVPVKEQKEITGHAVRAMYLYTGAADVAAAKNDPGYMNSMKTVWEDVVYRNMYITGGIGSSGKNEGFSQDFELPNEDAYCETCASVGMVFWNQRMNLLTGDSKYIDVLERSLYNGALDGLSFKGDRFFYGNPLASLGDYERKEWFGTACCPANISRLIASVGDYIYAQSDDAIWINLFVGSSTNLTAGKNNISIQQQTTYPWDGDVSIKISPERKTKHKLKIRIPGWAQGRPVPGDTYSYLEKTSGTMELKVNGRSVPIDLDKGYAVLDREWKKGDVIQLHLPMDVQKVVAINDVKEDVDKVALERGPLLYCLESVDNNGQAMNVILPDNASCTSQFEPDLLGGIVTLQCKATLTQPSGDRMGIETVPGVIKAVPYYTWANRGGGQMQVWIQRRIRSILVK
ncbi:MAG TPA: beta-L-arabinofuranosidase domain-containing protein [Chryseolinea sp.]|nr:beta-L-arabinofuranosidase domain-containing protein [Chryseolinea sp.]